MPTGVVIPAVKKSVAFPDDIVKKLAGTPLVQRAIEKGVAGFGSENVWVVTDSDEIQLICERNDVGCLYEPALRLDNEAYLESLAHSIQPLAQQYARLLILSPYAPLLTVDQLKAAEQHFIESRAEVLVPVSRSHQRIFSPWPRPVRRVLHEGGAQEIAGESRAFTLLASQILNEAPEREVLPVPHPVNGRLLEIRSYEDWWICEKLIQRRRIVFRVIGNSTVGMGHIFRCLALAHEISDHEIRFVCDTQSQVAVSKLAGYDYWLGVYPVDEIVQGILALEPDLVVNDILNTDADYIQTLKENGIAVVNFEDLGSGAAAADLTINDLYDEPQISGEQIQWGHSWFFVREEFTDATPREFTGQVQRVLLTFGGTDPSDLTRLVLALIAPYCRVRGIGIDIVTGDGYPRSDELEASIRAMTDLDVQYTHATGVISRMMERADIAIASNGRTVYELAHMNVPAIVLSHHARETTHRYACEANGFVPLGIYEGTDADERLMAVFSRLVEDATYRRGLHEAQSRVSFTENKKRVVRRLHDLASKPR